MTHRVVEEGGGGQEDDEEEKKHQTPAYNRSGRARTSDCRFLESGS